MVDVGQVFKSKSCGLFEVISVRSFKSVDIRFVDTGYELTVRCDSVEKGSIKDRLYRSVHNVGFIGVGDHITSVNGRNNRAYLTWQRMIGRCYGRDGGGLNGYEGCSVHIDWHNFQNFARWFYINYLDTGEEMHLDKDIKIKGNKVYSSDTCTFVTLRENIVAAKAKEFKVVSPNGDVVGVYNLSEFCRKHGLNKANMHKVIKGKHKSCKGWTQAHE